MRIRKEAERKHAMSGYQKRLIDKLGVKPDSKVTVLGVSDETFWKQLKQRETDMSRGRLRKDSDFIFLSAKSKEDLGKVRHLQNYIKRNGAIWVITPKGKKHIREIDVITAGKKAGLVDVKVARFSQTHTALKLVIPLARR